MEPPPSGTKTASGGPGEPEVWVTLEERGGFFRGEEITLEGRRSAVEGDRGWVEVQGPPAVLVGIGRAGTAATTPPRGAEHDDLRTLPVRFDPRAMRGRPFGNGVEALTETDMGDWRISGLRTSLWLCRALSEGGQTPTQHHYWWRSILQLASSDPGVDEHKFLAECLEQAVAIDQLNVGELHVFERISRRFLFWEEMFAAALRSADAGTGSDDAWIEERRLFMGESRAKGCALVFPALEQHVTSKRAEESAILKERRKGQEERQKARGEVAPTAADEKRTRGRGRGRG